jgi:hypothetical protein
MNKVKDLKAQRTQLLLFHFFAKFVMKFVAIGDNLQKHQQNYSLSNLVPNCQLLSVGQKSKYNR